MPDRFVNLVALSRPHFATTGMALLMSVIPAQIAWPQSAPPPPTLGIQTPAQQAVPDRPAPAPSESTPSSPPSAREENPGLFNEMGKLFEKSLSILPTLKTPGDIVKGRAACPVAANGAPDCKQGADKLCQSKGFKEGKSLDTDAAEKCAGKVYLPGYTRQPGDCRTENYVTRALCQ